MPLADDRGAGNAEVESLSLPWTSKNQWIVDTHPNGAAVMRDASGNEFILPTRARTTRLPLFLSFGETSNA